MLLYTIHVHLMDFVNISALVLQNLRCNIQHCNVYNTCRRICCRCTVHKATFTWENICTSTERIIFLETLRLAQCAYCTLLLGCRQTAKHFESLSDLIGENYYSVWRRDLRLLLITQILFVFMLITVGVLDIFHEIREFYEFHTVFFFMLYYVTDHAGFMSEHCCIYAYTQTYCSELK